MIYLSRAFGMNKEEANAMYVTILIVVVVGERPRDHARVAAVRPDRAQAADLHGLRRSPRPGRRSSRSPRPSRWRLVGAALFGAANGSFLAVDWALMTDIIPRVSAGRYMGLSNVATGSAAPLSIAIGGLVLDVVAGAGNEALSPRIVFVVGVAFFGIAALTLRPVVEPRRGRGSVPEGAAA